MNRWNIPAWLEQAVVARDRCCVYCGRDFSLPAASRAERPSWEHINNDVQSVTLENVALCCGGCNSSKGALALAEWLSSEYCRAKGITAATVAPVVRAALDLAAGSGSLSQR
jgi:hypothetical protein